jgi:hypothetical protein
MTTAPSTSDEARYVNQQAVNLRDAPQPFFISL